MNGFDEFAAYAEAGYGDPGGGMPDPDQAGAIPGAGADEDLMAAVASIRDTQAALADQFARLEAGFERIAANLNPLLTRQHQATLERIRALEVRIRNRQERPLINRMAELLGSVRRLDSGADIKLHVEENLTDALASYGYTEFGEVGDAYDYRRHEPLAGSAGDSSSVVSRVLQRGLASYDDVIIKALVEVRPGISRHDPWDGGNSAADSEQEEFPA